MRIVQHSFTVQLAQAFPDFRLEQAVNASGSSLYCVCRNCAGEVALSPSVFASVSSERAAEYVSSNLVRHRQMCKTPGQIALEVQQRQTVVPEVKQFARKYTVTE